jgi:signal transduction histidine kinase
MTPVKTVLVVEDEPGMRATLAAILEEEGYRVVACQDGAEVLRCISKTPVDVVIADLNLPDISGLEILTSLRGTHPDAVFILMTGNATVETAIEAVNQGAFAYHLKPLDIDALINSVRHGLEQQRLLVENRNLLKRLQRFNNELELARDIAVEASTSLEQKVEQRTQELVSTNEDLKKEIAERQRAEAEVLETRDIALKASHAKSDFLASMSHEIRTPLNAIIGMAELLSETQLNSEQQGYLRVFRTAGDTLLNTINSILDLSKLEAGQVILEGVEFDLRELVENTVEVLGMRAHEKGLELNCHVAPDVPTALVGDPVRLGPVITNLLGNAIKFTEKGEVVLYVENDPEANVPGALRFRVCDTGIGIPPDKLDVIFENFVQADSSITREFGGSGLGLTISRRLVELMGGRIWVESTLGEGSTFHFTVRFEAPDQANARGINRGSAQELPSVASFTTSNGRALRILLVEDSEDNRMLIQAYLRNTPHQITVAENGEIARRKFVAGNYDLVLMDMQMPVMDGYSATKAIRKWQSEQGVSPTAIIALTAYALKEEVQKSLDAGCTAHITKPIKKAQLFDAIYEQIEMVTA